MSVRRRCTGWGFISSFSSSSSRSGFSSAWTVRHRAAKAASQLCLQLLDASGAHLQPWTFVAISNPGLKRRIRDAAEAEEKRFYEERMPEAWEEVLTPLGTDYVKNHITEAPWIVVLFRQSQRMRGDDDMSPTYYSQESCGIAAGLFIAAVHNMGLTTLTHTPSPMGFLRDILGRPYHEHAMLLMPVGYPAGDSRVPDLKRKDLDEVSEFFD